MLILVGLYFIPPIMFSSFPSTFDWTIWMNNNQPGQKTDSRRIHPRPRRRSRGTNNEGPVEMDDSTLAPEIPPPPRKSDDCELTTTHIMGPPTTAAGWSVEQYAVLGTCPTVRTVKCPRKLAWENETKNTFGKAKGVGRALVLYMLHGWEKESEKSGSTVNEWTNFAFFLQFGMLSNGVSTELFDGVDYVFARTKHSASAVTTCSHHDNVRFVWVPTGPCDLCSHYRVLTWLGFDAQNVASWPYKSVIFMNSGVRGPFLHENSSSWIDIVSMAGQNYRSLLRENDASFRTVHATAMSWEVKMHAQSYFLAVPASALAIVHGIYGRGACGGSDEECVHLAEIPMATHLVDGDGGGLTRGLQEAPFSVYIALQNFTYRRGMMRRAAERAYIGRPGAVNPCFEYTDPCQGIFVKFGGRVWRDRKVHAATRKALSHLTMLMEAQNTRQPQVDLRPLLASCKFFRNPNQ
jgi:hypothetical protein